MLKFKRSGLIILFCFISSLIINGQNIESGKVYRFNNVGKPGNTLSLSGATQAAVGAPSNNSDLKQQWYVTSNVAGTGYYLRNVSNGAYLGSPKKIYTQWPVTFTTSPDDATMVMAINPYEGNYVIKALSQTDQYAYAHNDGSNNIVCWLASSTPTQWDFEEVPMTEEEIASMLRRFSQTGDEIAKASTYETYLDNLFIDKACTQPKINGNVTDNSSYQALPPVLQEMVKKAYDDNWVETTGDWDSEHAKKYRIQLYEPYSEGSAAAGLAGIQAYTNMNNPTGIIANAGEILYIMVDNDVPDGATLYIGGVPDCSMYNSVTAGTKLKKGLNMIMCNSDLTHYFIYYTVNTVENNKPVAARALKNYDPITIHIEGGQINGFFNYVGDKLYTADTKADFDYTTARAKHPMYDLIGKYVILHFYLEDTPNVPGGTPEICVKNAFNPEVNKNAKHLDPVVTMTAWDNMCFAERILMGIMSDDDIADSFNEGLYESIVNQPYKQGEYNADPGFYYCDYFNNRMMGINYQAANLYMNATSWRTAYAPSTIGAILSQFPEDGIWGPAHEYGHMNQGPISIAGTTEESNNIFSNVANYYVCKTTSRCDYPSEQLKNFLAGNTYLDNGTWGTTRMFWQLWCYYHKVGHNKKFYPRLFELLRKYPLKRETTTYNGKLNAKPDMLHFAKMCCIAAGEDLTNFFASWGFFSPQESYHIDDYSVYDMIVTPQDIADIKAEIKSFGFPKNDAIILIDDRPGSELPTGFGYNKAECGEYGGISSFTENNSASGDFTFTVDGNNVTVTGNGNPGVGFLIYDEDGNLIGFSNSNSFTLSPQAAEALVDGKATVKAVGADNTVVEAVDPVRDGSVDNKKELLKTLIDRCDALLDLADESLTHVGRLIPKSCDDLKAHRDEVYKVWESSADSEELTDVYLSLSKEYYALLNDNSARIAIEPGSSYRLINHNYTSRALDAGEDKAISSTINTASDMVSFSQQWVLQPIAEGNTNEYYIKNLGDGRYLQTTKKQSTSIPLGASPQSYTLIMIEQGVYAFAPDNEVKFGIHIDAGNNVVQWNTTSLPTQWSMVKICSAQQISLRNSLEEKLTEAQNLLNTCGTIERVKPVEYNFPENCMYTNAPYKGNNSDKFTSWSVLFDKNTATYFHSNYDNNVDSEDGLDHYIRMEAPEESTFRFFDLSYITRQTTNTGTNPKTIVIEASKDKNSWREIYHASGLKTGSAVSNETGEIYAPEGTKYIRFVVTGATSLAKGHPYFCLSELSVRDLGEPIFTPDEGFPYLKADEMQSLYDDIVNAKLDLAYSSTSVEDLSSRISQIEQASATIQSVMIPAVDVTGLSFSVDPIVLKVGDENFTVTATVEPENATFPQFEWWIEDENIAVIESTDGKSAVIKPVSNGVTNLSIRVIGNPMVSASAILKILPEVPVEGIVVSPAELTLPVNAGNMSLSAIIFPDNATIQTVTWTSSDPSIVEIDEETGILSLLRQGNVEIIATATDGTDLKGKCILTVSNPVAEGLMIYPLETVMEPGDEVQFNASYLPEDAIQPLMNWSSDNALVATVDPSGMVKAISAGEAVITVTSLINDKEITASANVKVNPLTPKAILMSAYALTLDKGESTELTVTISPEGVENDIIWFVSDENVISISVASDKLSATVTAVKAGMATITAYSERYPDIYGVCNITVPEIVVTDIQLEDRDYSFDFEDGAQTLKVTIYPLDAPVPRLIWTSDNESVATIEITGPTEALFTPVSNGETTITVSHAERPEISDARTIVVTGASGIANLFEDKVSKVDVYLISGQIVKHNADLRKLNDLKPGIYVIKQGKISKEILVR